jgi:hypothetical protein
MKRKGSNAVGGAHADRASDALARVLGPRALKTPTAGAFSAEIDAPSFFPDWRSSFARELTFSSDDCGFRSS